MDKYNKRLWFRWDHQARNDKKVLKLKQKEGHAGYGIFVQICELLYENDGQVDFEYICYDLRCMDDSEQKDQVKRILNDFELFSCIDKSQELYTSERISHEIMSMNKRKRSGSKAANARWHKKPEE